MDNKKKYVTLPIKITIIIVLFLTSLFLIISLIFYNTNQKLKNAAYKRLDYSAGAIRTSIDDLILNIYNASDTFALDDRLSRYTNVDLSDNPIKKRQVTVQIANQLFASYDLLHSNQKMTAYFTQKGEFFNFIDPNNDTENCKKRLEGFDINNRSKLARFCWYNVCDNFFRTSKTGNLRKDMVIIGSRRIFSRTQSTYVGVHIFGISEDDLYSIYKNIADEYNADIYVIDTNGQLFSSSNTDALTSGKMDSELMSFVLNRKFDRFNYGNHVVSVAASQTNDWITVISAPISNVTAVIDSLHNWIFLLIIGAAIAASILILLMYRQFMRPIAKLNVSMRRVYDGDLTAYIEENANNEMGQMIRFYNDMLSSINHNIKEKLILEKQQKELENEVLMNQINPHLLYNTLETIVWKSSEAGSPDIGRLAASLGHMYRMSVAEGALFVTIKHEIEHVNTYIKIQRHRYHDKFNFEICANNSELLSYYTPKIIIQPIVENSINHAMDGIGRPLRIRIRIRVYDDFIRITITDNGKGMSHDELLAVREQIRTGIIPAQKSNRPRKSSGLGLHNIYRRLELYLNTDNPLEIYSKSGIGTSVVINIPKATKETANGWNRKNFN